MAVYRKPPTRVKVTAPHKVHARGLRQVSRAARKAGALSGPGGLSSGKEAAGDLALRLREAGEYVAAIARGNAAEFSDKVPASIKVMGGISRVYVRAGGPSAPAAYTAETAARHPVFGNRAVWVQGPIHPFLAPAAEEGAEGAAVIVARVVDDWAADYGFK